jgi:general secretion pathway protein M
MHSEWRTGRRGQALALAVTLLVGAIIWVGLLQPLLSWHAERAETLAERRALADLKEGLAVTLPSLRRQAEAWAGGQASAGVTLSGASDAVAGAMLQERVQIMATAAGATPTSVETLAAEQTGTWRRIGLRVALTTTWPVLVMLLQALDQATPRMLVDDLHVHSTLLVANPVALPLQTSFTIYAFRTGAAPVASRQ